MGLAKSQQSLKNWTDQKWMTSGTHANKKRGSSKEVKANGKKRYLPEAAWDSLSSGEKAATNEAKAKGNSKGKQFVSQPKGIKEKTKSFRKFGGANNNKSEIMKSMYKKGGKPSKKKVMKEAKKEGESFMVENKELSFGAPQMKMGGMKKYSVGGPTGSAPLEKKGTTQSSMKKKKGGFDLNDDGKTTFKDVLIGRGVIDKKKKGGAKSMEPGGGGRFAKMVSGLKKEGKSEDSAKAIAASIGRKKYGKSKFQAMAAAGKKRMGGKKC